ncbi:MAG: hypothetical protein ABIP08_14630 [Lautropia sp.]
MRQISCSLDTEHLHDHRLRHLPVERGQDVRAIDLARMVQALRAHFLECLPVLCRQAQFRLAHGNPFHDGMNMMPSY